MHTISQRFHNAVAQNDLGRGELIDEVAFACTAYTGEYLAMLREGHWSLAHAHEVLTNKSGIDNLDLLQISGLARAMQIYQSSK